jgi:molybdenum cofactor biosynthesis protein B
MKVHEEHKKQAPKSINLALIIVSTSRYNEIQASKKSSDKTIPLVKKIIQNYGTVSLVFSEIIPDSSNKIMDVLDKLLKDNSINAIVFSGGTGLSPKDLTYETLEPLLEKKIDGFGELFRVLSYKEIGSSAMLSRAIAGIIGNKIILLLPGSPNAVKLALDKLIIPELGHIIYLITKKE